jgi:hypothetical protein
VAARILSSAGSGQTAATCACKAFSPRPAAKLAPLPPSTDAEIRPREREVKSLPLYLSLNTPSPTLRSRCRLSLAVPRSTHYLICAHASYRHVNTTQDLFT